MKKIFLGMLLLLGFPVLYAQNEKNVVVDANAEVRSVTGFSAIEVSGAIDLYLSQGTEEAVAISASSDDIKARIRTEVKGNTLHIYFDGKGVNWKSWGNNRMRAYVTFKTLTHIESSGACNIKATEAIKGDELKIELSGASDFTGAVNVSKLRLDASGASHIKVSGTAANTNVDATGASNVRAYDLSSENCKIDASGGCNIYVTVNKELSARASGGSGIYYRGTGLIRDISTSGGASIKRKTDD